MTQPSATTALTRLHVDLTGVPEALITSLHDLIREELAAHGLPDTTHRTQLATLTQRGEAETLHLVQDREIEIPQHAELRPPAGHEDEDGAYVSAWVWVPGLSQPLTLKRAQRIAQHAGYDLNDAQLQACVDRLHATYGPHAELSQADIQDALADAWNESDDDA